MRTPESFALADAVLPTRSAQLGLRSSGGSPLIKAMTETKAEVTIIIPALSLPPTEGGGNPRNTTTPRECPGSATSLR